MNDYQFQLQQLLDANLVEGEQIEMESELETLNYTEEIKSNLFKASALLNEGDIAVVSLLKEARSAIGQI